MKKITNQHLHQSGRQLMEDPAGQMFIKLNEDIIRNKEWQIVSHHYNVLYLWWIDWSIDLSKASFTTVSAQAKPIIDHGPFFNKDILINQVADKNPPFPWLPSWAYRILESLNTPKKTKPNKTNVILSHCIYRDMSIHRKETHYYIQKEIYLPFTPRDWITIDGTTYKLTEYDTEKQMFILTFHDKETRYEWQIQKKFLDHWRYKVWFKT